MLPRPAWLGQPDALGMGSPDGHDSWLAEPSGPVISGGVA